MAFRRSWPQEASISPPQLAAHRNGHAVPLQAPLKSGHPAAGLQWTLLHIIERDQVDMAGCPLQQPSQEISLPVKSR